MATWMRVAVILAVGSTGCAGSFEEARAPSLRVGAPPPSARCASLDNAHRDWGAVAKGSAVLSGAAGLSTLPVPSDEKALRIGVGAGSLAFAALATLAVYESEGAGESWARECAGR